jgi:hypothetical protein
VDGGEPGVFPAGVVDGRPFASDPAVVVVEVDSGVTLAQNCEMVSPFAWAAAPSCENARELPVAPWALPFMSVLDLDAAYAVQRPNTLAGVIVGPGLFVVGVVDLPGVSDAWLFGWGMETPMLDKP